MEVWVKRGVIVFREAITQSKQMKVNEWVRMFFENTRIMHIFQASLAKAAEPERHQGVGPSLENTCCPTVARQKGVARGTLGHASDPLAMLNVLLLPRKRDRAKRNRANIRRLGSAFHTFHSLEPRGTPEHVSDILLSLQKTWTPTNARTYTRSLNKQCAFFHACSSKAERRRPSETRANIRPLCTKHSPTLSKEGKARGMKKLPLKRCGARGTPRCAATLGSARCPEAAT